MSPNHDRAISRWFLINDGFSFELPHPGRKLVLAFLNLLIVCGWVSGCQGLQRRTTQRSARCGDLCAKARESREQGDADQADRYINEALRQRPSDIETRRQLAETMWTSGRRDEALSQYSSLCEQQPHDAKLAARLAIMQWETNQHSAAANTATAVLLLDPVSKDALLIRARNEVAEGKLDDALASYIRLSQVDPDDLTVLIELGELHLKRGQPDRACPLFRTALQHPMTDPVQRAEIEWRLGLACVRSERWSIAVSMLERAITKRRSSADDWCLLGWTRLQCGDITGAQSDLQQALLNDPDSVAARELAKKLELSAHSTPSVQEVTPAAYREPQ